MFKKSLIVLMLLSQQLSLAGPIAANMKSSRFDEEAHVDFMIERGFRDLFANDPVRALYEFIKLENYLNHCEEYQIENLLVTALGKSLAYDGLGMSTESDMALAGFSVVFDEIFLNPEAIITLYENNLEIIDGCIELLKACSKLFSFEKRVARVESWILYLEDLKTTLDESRTSLDLVYGDGFKIELCKSDKLKKIEKVSKNLFKVILKLKYVWEFLKDVFGFFGKSEDEKQ